ncbi:MAG: chemotaxis protein CheA, partial [Candidatus Hydrogenedentes bacterium]|nr:chemotaxis protein CheA [Candidatus Hydrogenedentota bacterium]
MDTELTVDAALRTEFIDESLDMLAGLEGLFVTLEGDPENLETVQDIFRPIHSIKGNSSFFDFPGVKTLAHEMETILDLVRQKNLGVSEELIGAELAGVDLLKEMLERGRANEAEVRDQAFFDGLVQRVKDVAAQEMGAAEISQMVMTRLKEIKATLGGEHGEASSALDALIQKLGQFAVAETQGTDAKTAEGGPLALIRLFEILDATIEGSLEDALAREVGQCLTALKEEPLSDEDQASLDNVLDSYNTFMDSLGFDDLLQDIILEGLQPISFPTAAAPDSSATDESPPDKATGTPKGTDAKPAAPHEEVAKTMRVSEKHVDTFLSYVGELLVVRDMFNHLETRLAGMEGQRPLRTDFRRVNETFATLSDELQKSIMSIRRVAVGTILQRVPRLVRDIATASNKEINVEIEGENLEVDKSLIDLLEAPLTHMVRNGADHGIEAPDVREAAGKPRAGTILVSVTEIANSLSLTIRDDGAGLDYDKIQGKAVELGIVEAGKPLTEEDIVNFLFQSGVSTATEVTDVSGRGVGMDVVKRMVEEAGGSIHVSSKRGEGSTFEVTVPKSVTTQIVSGFLVESGRQRFVFPMTKVLETTRLDCDKILTVADRGRCFKHHDSVIPLVSMDRLLGLIPDTNGKSEYELVVTLASRQGTFGVAVDQVVGVQQVVLRHIDGLTRKSES